ncbi:MAG: toll/interleukin-1 receptor domain-containing protein [Lentisphaeria bacterium]|nr:toll/interleukin-1 receptor domain-containing protein [Lentisphaeria bacterium]
MTLREQLDKCLAIKKEIRHKYDVCNRYSTEVGPLTKKLMSEVKTLVALLPSGFKMWKDLLTADLGNMSSGNNYINAFTYGAFTRSLEELDKLISSVHVKKIFISHSSKDKIVVEAFVDLLRLGANISHDDIFCTSIENMKIHNGEDIRKHIQENVKHADFAILLISKNYKNSEICLNEMGAVWAVDKNIRTYVLPGIKEASVGWLIDTKVAEKIDDLVALTSLYSDITKFYASSTDMVLWTAQATKFLNSLK